MKKIIKLFLFKTINFLHYFFGQKKIIILINQNIYSKELEIELERRAKFYFNNIDAVIKVEIINKKSIYFYLFNPCVKVMFGIVINNDFMNYNQNKLFFFDVDFNNNPNDGWEWHNALTKFTYRRKAEKNIIEKSSIKFKQILSTSQKYEKAYIIGTGPSLSKASEIDWSDGYRIVCNTIVKDQIMWKHINPQFIVAGDAIYHFGSNNFALSFIDDLIKRLRESNTFFIYPFYFHSYVSRVLEEFKDRLIPIPIVDRDLIHISLLKDFRLPDSIGNVLNLLLLPIATTLSKNVFLFGFDGRAPNDKLFWTNSSKHTYEDKLVEIIKQHPKFFDFHVPKQGENNYVNDVHGHKLEKILITAEKEGWSFVMMHKSWTETLNRRFAN